MRVLETGHRYEVANFGNPETFQEIAFVSKSPVEDGSKEMKLNFDGTTNEELLAVLIDRTTYLQSLFPCKENACAITKMQEAKFWFEERTRNRVARHVEGKHTA